MAHRLIGRAGLAGAMVLLFVAAACSSSSKSSSSSSSSAASSSSSSSSSASSPTTTAAISAAQADSAAAALLPAAIKSKGSIVVALDATYPPDEMIASDGKTVIGFDADLMTALGQVLGVKAQLQNATFDTIIPGILSGKFDLGASSFTDTKAREQQVDFVTYFSSGEGFYIPANSTASFNGLSSLCNKKVSVEKGTTEETDAQTQAKSCTVNVLSFDDQNAANLAVSSGRADVGFADSQVAGYIVATSNGQFKLTGQPFSTAPYGLAMTKNGLAPAVLAAMKDLISDGVYSQILTKWGIQAGAITSPVINGATS